MTDSLASRRTAFDAVAARVVPADDFPSAAEAGAWEYACRLLDRDLSERRAVLGDTLDRLDALARSAGTGSFVEADPAAQDATLAALLDTGDPAARSAAAWLVEIVLESYYADPANGGNGGAVSWRMVGYDPGVPGYDGTSYFRERR